MARVLRRVQSFWAALVVCAVLAAPALAIDRYEIDPDHSSIIFDVKHLTVSRTTGEFTDYSGVIDFDPNSLLNSKIDVVVQAKSIDTRLPGRDAHLRGPEFFDVEKYPTISFKSSKIVRKNDYYMIVGALTLHGITKEIIMTANIGGPIQGLKGEKVLGITGELYIDRLEYGIRWDKKMDNGASIVNKMVTINVHIEARTK